MDTLIIEWDGRHVPDELRSLPPGRYVLEPMCVPLSADEEEGIRQALQSLDAGQGLSFDEVMRELEADFEDS